MGGRKDSFLCPNGTIFNQKVFVCDWWHNVQCDESTNSFGLNANIYDYNYKTKTQPQSQSQSQTGQRGIRRTGTQEDINQLMPTAKTTTEKPSSSSETEFESDSKSESDSSSDSDAESDSDTDTDTDTDDESDSESAASIHRRRKGIESGKVYFDDEVESSSLVNKYSLPLQFKSTSISAHHQPETFKRQYLTTT